MTHWPVTVRAQRSGRLPVVGVLWGSAEAAASYRLPFLKGLAELGHEPGKTFILEERYANEVPERFDALATELVNLKVDVLVGAGGSSIWALHRATSTIPTVFVGRRPGSARFRVEPIQAGRKYERHNSNDR